MRPTSSAIHSTLACTTTDNEQHILQVEADLVEPSISYLLDGELVHRDKYQNLSKLILKELVTLDFDHLIRTGLDAAQREPAAIQEDVKPYHRYSVIEASSTDSYVPDGGRFAIFDEATWDYYFDEDSWAKVFPDAESAAQFIKELEKADAEKQQPDLTGQPITREGDTLTIGNGPATHEVDITVSDEVWKQIKEAIPDNTVQNFHIPMCRRTWQPTVRRRLLWSSSIVTLPHGSNRSGKNRNPPKKSRQSRLNERAC